MSNAALVRYPQDDRIHYERALGLESKQQIDAAIAEMEAALASEADVRAVYVQARRATASAKGLHSEAIAQEQRLLEVDPTHIHSYYALADAFLETAQPLEAEEICPRRYWRHGRRAPSAWALLARVLARNGKHGEADAAVEQALAIDWKVRECPVCEGRLAPGREAVRGGHGPRAANLGNRSWSTIIRT